MSHQPPLIRRRRTLSPLAQEAVVVGVAVALLLVVPSFTFCWVLVLALTAFALGGGEWGLFGEPGVGASWWADAVGWLVAVAGVVLVASSCIGVPTVMGLRLHDRRQAAEGGARPDRRLPRRVLVGLIVSLGVLVITSIVLYLLALAA